IYLGEASKEYCERVYPDTPIKKYKAKQDKVAKYHDDAKNRKILTDDMGAYPVPLTPYSNEPIYIFNVGLVEQVKFPNRTDELLERIAEDVYDEIGDYAEDYLDDVDEKHQTELQELIRDWAERHDYLPNYFTISLTELIDTRNLEEV
ncbi:hypothetical protein E1V05_08620, partial [Listeria monocytogenes]|nr:hypothetical protein [Listeria monocytogenes]